MPGQAEPLQVKVLPVSELNNGTFDMEKVKMTKIKWNNAQKERNNLKKQERKQAICTMNISKIFQNNKKTLNNWKK